MKTENNLNEILLEISGILSKIQKFEQENNDILKQMYEFEEKYQDIIWENDIRSDGKVLSGEERNNEMIKLLKKYAMY